MLSSYTQAERWNEPGPGAAALGSEMTISILCKKNESLACLSNIRFLSLSDKSIPSRKYISRKTKNFQNSLGFVHTILFPLFSGKGNVLPACMLYCEDQTTPGRDGFGTLLCGDKGKTRKWPNFITLIFSSRVSCWIQYFTDYNKNKDKWPWWWCQDMFPIFLSVGNYPRINR